MEKFLPLYVAGDLAGRRATRRVANHLATCERCRAAAGEYVESRSLVRAASTLPPDFDGAFYEELRRSVLAEIKRTRLAPPASAGRATLFNARFAYAASLALVLATVAALSLHSYVGRKSVDGVRPDFIADVNREQTGPAGAPTPLPTRANQVQGDGGHASTPADERARKTRHTSTRLARSSTPPRRANYGDAQNEPGRRVNVATHAPPHVKRNPLAPIVAAAASAGEIARSDGSSGEATGAHEVSRIEIQTSDPNIRIIWLSPKPDGATAQPLK